MPGSFLRIRPIAPIDFVNSWRKTMCRRNTAHSARKSFSHWIRQIFIQDASYHREYFFVFQAVASCCHALCQKELFFPRSSPGALHRSMVQNLVTTLPRGTVSGIANASTVSGNLRNGTVTGTIGAGGGAPTDYMGEVETAPDHIYVRCLIRAKP